MRRCLATLLLFATFWCGAPAARAQQTIGDNDYSIDLAVTPVLGPNRVVSLGGAYTALASGIDGVPWNPAANASRMQWELSWFEWEITGSLIFPIVTGINNDVDNDGLRGIPTNNYVFVDFGGRMQFGDLGIGSLWSVQRYQLSDGSQPIDVTLLVGHTGAAYSLLDGQLVLGGGVRIANLDVSLSSTGQSLVTFTGLGPEAGVQVRPTGKQWRFGMSIRTGVSSDEVSGQGIQTDANGVRRAGSFVTPSSVHMPWEVQMGFAYQFGHRPLNDRFVNPRDEEAIIREAVERSRSIRAKRREAAGPPDTSDPYRWPASRAMPHGPLVPVMASPGLAGFWPSVPAATEEDAAEIRQRQHEEDLAVRTLSNATAARSDRLRRLPREYVLATVDLILVGPTANGLGFNGFLTQNRDLASGQNVSIGVRAGAETEPWLNRLKVRAGTYLEPSRFRKGHERLHGTLGFDLRVFRWNVFGLIDPTDFRITAVSDISSRYFAWGLGFGVWH